MSAAHDLTETYFTTLLRQRDFKQLFNRLGWDNIPKGTPDVLLSVPGPPPVAFTFKPVKEKHGFVVLHCAALPTTEQRRRLSLDMSKRYAEHLLIYAPDANGAEQLWQLVVRDPGQPVRFFEFRVGATQKPRALWQRVEGLAISLDDDETGLTLTQVREKTRRAFALNAGQVTNKFYQEFSQQHQSFQELIKGIESSTDRAWYASIMLNRIMFIYFVQAQGYLLVDAAGPSGKDDKEYLDFKLKQCAKLVGKDKFQSFYQDFLRVLFRDGLNAPLPHTPGLAKLLGRVPYLNGGLFEEHELERTNAKLQIPDAAFEKLFAFLGKWDWILDSRQQATGTTINPDVLGYIFEQYINSLERKANGSYYTKEDITDYIAKNCLVPALFDRMAATVSHGDEVWDLLRDYPDKYLYPAQRNGLHLPLPAEVEAGRLDVAARASLWNRPTPKEYGLPTEIWRETVQRRDRTIAAQARLMSGEVRTINELITLNLDVRQFLHDAILNAGNAEWVWACFEGLRSLSILDPTCGSGAFLFAALRLLEPLYEECLDRMLAFLPELENAKTLPVKRRVVEGMRKVRQELVENHQENRAYFITKTIILHNLYGVDLMHEAVEIAKLRLFLQLMSTLPEPDYDDPNLGLEPLPDVDFNIRAGNTLVGFATRAELQKGLDYHLDGRGAEPAILEQADVVARVYAEFKRNQEGDDQAIAKKSKSDLAKELKKLNHRLNKLLHKQNTTVDFEDFCQNYQPFHWFAEFYEIVTEKGGFDIVIGNPPYLEYSEVKKKYRLNESDFKTFKCGNLYAYTWERALKIGSSCARTGMIIPVASVCTDDYAELQKILHKTGTSIISNFNDRPSKLFENLEHIRLAIILHEKTVSEKTVSSSRYYKWKAVERDFLFEQLSFVNTTKINLSGAVAKVGSKLEASLIAKTKQQKKNIGYYTAKIGTVDLYYTRKLSNYVQILNFIPEIRDKQNNQRLPTELKKYSFLDSKARDSFLALYNSSLFFYLITVYSDCRNLNKRELESICFDFESTTTEVRNQLQDLAAELMDDINTNSKMMKMGELTIQCTFPKLSKTIIDKIDKVLAVHYGFTDEELDFIINYDIKYRMGTELNAD